MCKVHRLQPKRESYIINEYGRYLTLDIESLQCRSFDLTNGVLKIKFAWKYMQNYCVLTCAKLRLRRRREKRIKKYIMLKSIIWRCCKSYVASIRSSVRFSSLIVTTESTEFNWLRNLPCSINTRISNISGTKVTERETATNLITTITVTKIA